MADEATLGNGPANRINSPIVEGIVGNVTEFGSNLLSLAELQGQLALCDAQDAAAKAKWSVVLAVLGVVLALVALPVLLIGLGFVLARALDVPQGVGLLIAGGAGLALGGLLAFLFGRRIGSSFESFRRSTDEFGRNLAWLKTVLAHSGKSAARR